jgi:acetoin utilization protein AcuA
MLNLEWSLVGGQDGDLLARSACRAYTTPVGTIYLRDRCPASFVEQLSVDEGLHAFARTSEREYELLLKLARSDKGELALAYTGEGIIVGQITFADAEAWWGEIDMTREVAIEVSANWRKLGIARQLIELVMAREDLENWILLAMGLSWHWETEQLGLTRARYRELLASLVAPYGFAEYLTTEPNIRDDPANILLARLGSRVEPSAFQQFYSSLLHSEALPGM